MPMLAIYQPTWDSISIRDSRYTGYNLFFYAFALDDPLTLDVSNYPGTGAGLTSDIAAMHAVNRKVILSLGGEGGAVNLNNTTTENSVFNNVITLIDTYGFDGVDYDMEAGTSLTAVSLANVAGRLKLRYGSSFIITCAPAPQDATYLAFARATGGGGYTGRVCDLMIPQYYGWPGGPSTASIVGDVKAWADGTGGAAIPAINIGIGCTDTGGAVSGTFPAVSVYKAAYDQLKADGYQVRGVFIWNTTIERGANNFRFMNAFVPVL